MPRRLCKERAKTKKVGSQEAKIGVLATLLYHNTHTMSTSFFTRRRPIAPKFGVFKAVCLIIPHRNSFVKHKVSRMASHSAPKNPIIITHFGWCVKRKMRDMASPDRPENRTSVPDQAPRVKCNPSRAGPCIMSTSVRR